MTDVVRLQVDDDAFFGARRAHGDRRAEELHIARHVEAMALVARRAALRAQRRCRVLGHRLLHEGIAIGERELVATSAGTRGHSAAGAMLARHLMTRSTPDAEVLDSFRRVTPRTEGRWLLRERRREVAIGERAMVERAFPFGDLVRVTSGALVLAKR